LGKTILEIEARGKRGVGCCKSMPGAARPFERLRSRLRPTRIYGVNTPEKSSVTSAATSEPWRLPEPTDLIFPKWQRELFKTILNEQNRQPAFPGTRLRTYLFGKTQNQRQTVAEIERTSRRKLLVPFITINNDRFAKERGKGVAACSPGEFLERELQRKLDLAFRSCGSSKLRALANK